MKRPVSAEESLKRMASFFEERSRQFIDTVRGAGGAQKSAEGMPDVSKKSPDTAEGGRSPKP